MNAGTRVTIEERTADRCLDCRGLRCPLPIVKLSRTVKDLDVGQTLWVEADDPAFKSDLEAWVGATGHELLEFSEGSTQQALVRKVSVTGQTL